MKKNILLVGAGNIGFRHFQSLLINKRHLNIFIFDKDPKKYFHLKSYFDKGIFIKKNIFLLKKIKDINCIIDLVIDATTCQNRFNLLLNIIRKINVKNFLIEKIIFDNEIHFKKLLKISIKKKLNMWVNCNRREVQIYQEIKRKIKNSNFTISYTGNRWGMASNLIHFIDLFDYFSTIKSPRLLINETVPVKSKRKGYKELIGKIKVSSNKNILTLEDSRKYKENILQIKFTNYIYQFKFPFVEIKNIKKNEIIKKKNNEELVSFATNTIVEKIFKLKKIKLSTLKNTYKHHYFLFKIIDQTKKKTKMSFRYT